MVTDSTELNKELARFSVNYYRDHFRRAVKFLLLLIFINVALIGAIFYLYVSRPNASHRFYASNMYNAKVTHLSPLSAPVVTPTRIIGLARQYVLNAFTFNFVNYRDIFSEQQKFFTTKGWQSFNATLQDSGILDKVTANKLFVVADASGNPTILNNEVVGGHYVWELHVPISLTFKPQNGSADAKPQTQDVVATITIIRVPNLNNPDEVAIDSINIG